MPSTNRGSDRIIVRLPDGLRPELKELARVNHRTMNGQVVAMLESGLAAEKTASNHTV